MDPVSGSTEDTSHGNVVFSEDLAYISYKVHVTNEDIRNKIKQTNLTKNSPSTVKKPKTEEIWSRKDHLGRHSERREKKREKERWEDNIKS